MTTVKPISLLSCAIPFFGGIKRIQIATVKSGIIRKPSVVFDWWRDVITCNTSTGSWSWGSKLSHVLWQFECTVVSKLFSCISRWLWTGKRWHFLEKGVKYLSFVTNIPYLQQIIFNLPVHSPRLANPNLYLVIPNFKNLTYIRLSALPSLRLQWKNWETNARMGSVTFTSDVHHKHMIHFNCCETCERLLVSWDNSSWRKIQEITLSG